MGKTKDRTFDKKLSIVENKRESSTTLFHWRIQCRKRHNCIGFVDQVIFLFGRCRDQIKLYSDFAAARTYVRIDNGGCSGGGGICDDNEDDDDIVSDMSNSSIIIVC